MKKDSGPDNFFVWVFQIEIFPSGFLKPFETFHLNPDKEELSGRRILWTKNITLIFKMYQKTDTHIY